MAKPRINRTTQKTPILPQVVGEFFATRWQEAKAAAIFASGAFVAGSLISYTTTDPSWNAAAPGKATTIDNWFGTAGAYTADVLWQALGLSSFWFAIAIFCWGHQYWQQRQWPVSRYRMLLLLPAILLWASALAILPHTGLFGIRHGGSAGDLLMNLFSSLLTPITGSWSRLTAFPFLLLGGSTCLLLTLGYSRYQWADLWAKYVGGHAQAPSRPPIGVRPKQRILPMPKANNLVVTTPKGHIAPQKISSNSRREKQPSLLNNHNDFVLPPLELLQVAVQKRSTAHNENALKKNAELLQTVLEDYSVRGDIVQVNPGPVVTLYELEPAPGLKSARVIGLADDIARSMHAVSVRVAVIPGKNAIGIELPNKDREIVYLRELLASEEFEHAKGKLNLVLGKDIGGQPIIADLAKMPHLLVAGTTGSGKSVGINAMILSLLYKHTPEECRLIMIDPKMLELSVYDDIPHLLTPVVTDPKKAIVALKWAVREMEDRYRLMSKLGVRNIEGYNQRLKVAIKTGEVLTRRIQTGFDPDTGKPIFEDQPIPMKELPFIVVVVDEFADLMLVAGKEVEAAIQRLAQMARAAGIHLIMATQRPSVDVITGTIKANFPSRISFQVTSRIDSRTILGESGAENLLGQGDMLYMAGGGRITRVHGPFVKDEEVEEIVKHLKTQGAPVYIDEVTADEEELASLFGGESGGDDLYQKAVQLVLGEKKASTSFVQRHLSIGYNRAAKIIEQMEKEGIISQANHVGRREVLM